MMIKLSVLGIRNFSLSRRNLLYYLIFFTINSLSTLSLSLFLSVFSSALRLSEFLQHVSAEEHNTHNLIILLIECDMKEEPDFFLLLCFMVL